MTSKPFTWSFSRLKAYANCPKRYYHTQILKDFAEEDSEQLQWGNAVHLAMKNRLMKGTPLPLGMQQYEEVAVRVLQRAKDGVLYAEQKLGLNRSFGPSGFFDGSVWYRAVIDVLITKGKAALLIDWKTGKRTEEAEGNQLGLNAAVVFAHQPQVQACVAEYHWLGAGGEPTRKTFYRTQMASFWNGVLPDVETLENATKTTDFPAQPSGLCKRWCPVRSCPHYGVG